MIYYLQALIYKNKTDLNMRTILGEKKISLMLVENCTGGNKPRPIGDALRSWYILLSEQLSSFRMAYGVYYLA